MRTDIYDFKETADHRLEKTLSLVKLLGKGMGRGLFFNCKSRYRFFKGARNTKKSKDIIGYEVVLKILSNNSRNVVILRQNDVDNRQTTFENIRGCIYDLGLEDFFLITKSPLCITYRPTGQQIIFKGMNNPTSINSLTFSRGYLTDVYIEEAYEVSSYDDFVKIDGSLRGKLVDKNGEIIHQQITCCFNAWNKGHWMYDLFFREQTGYEENTYVTSTLGHTNEAGEVVKNVESNTGSVVLDDSQEVFIKDSRDYEAYKKMVDLGRDKNNEIKHRIDTALVVSSEEFEAGLESGRFTKARKKIIFGMEDDMDYLDRKDVTFDYYDNPHFIGRYGKGLFLHTSTYKINEFRDKENYDTAMRNMKDTYLEGYKVEALGMWGNSSGATYPSFSEEKSLIDFAIAIGNTLPTSYVKKDKLNANGEVIGSEVVRVESREYDRYKYLSYAIGIDTGMSNGQGQKRRVNRGQDVLTRVRSATTMCLVGVTQLSVNGTGGVRDNKIVCLNEYFHSNDKAYSSFNTDGDATYKDPTQLADKLLDTIENWIGLYGGKVFPMGAMINVYIDNADVGFRQVMEMVANRRGLGGRLTFIGSTKLSIQTRVDFTNTLMAYGNFKIVGGACPNLVREIKNSRRGEKGEAREDTDDHEINACEYAWASLKNDIEMWKNYKEH